MTVNEFKDNFELEKVPTELEDIIIFQSNLPNREFYSDGFEIILIAKDWLKSWSEEENFINKLIPFAQANYSGSFYAIWINNNEKPLNQLPILVFGDEGGVHIVAENILQLLHLLTYDAEILVDENAAYFSKEKHEASKNLKEYLKYIKEKYNLEPISETERIIKIAQEKYQRQFNNWFNQYYKM
jgi:hypothetical protein